MAGISRFEKGVLLLTAGFVLFSAGWFLSGQRAAEPYTVTVETAPEEPPAPDPSLETAGEDGRPDSLLPGEVINVNAAGAGDLDRLPGIGPAKAEAILAYLGPAKAEAILAYREEHGPFQTVDGLLEVSGIGPVTLENLRPYVSVGE